MKDSKLEITLKISEDKGIIIGRSVVLFNKPRYVAGLWDNAVVFVSHNPKTLMDCQVCIYTINELKEFYEEGSLQKLVDING